MEEVKNTNYWKIKRAERMGIEVSSFPMKQNFHKNWDKDNELDEQEESDLKRNKELERAGL